VPQATQSGAPGPASLHDQAAESALLGCMIYDNATIAEILEIVDTGEMFSLPSNRIVFDAVVGMWSERKEINLVTLRAELARKNKLLEIAHTTQGASAFLAEYVETLPSTSASASYAAIVRDRYILRTIAQACSAVLQKMMSGEIDVDLVRNDAEQALFAALAKAERKPVATMVSLLQDVFHQIQDIHDRKSRLLGMPTGYYELDDMLSGLQDGQLYVVAGRPSMGKTSFGMNVVENIAFREEKPVLFFSLEMTGTQLAQSMLCSRARVDSNLLRTGRVSEEDFQRLVLAAGAYHDTKIFIDDASDLSALEMRTRARRLKQREDISLVVVDYLQKMSARQGPKYEGRQVEISNISGHLKAMAKELDVPVIAISQLNRSPEGREDRRPILSDLRESGAIEQDADVVMLLYREDYYDPETEKKGVAEIHVAKNRTGPVGMVNLTFLKRFTRFENLAARP